MMIYDAAASMPAYVKNPYILENTKEAGIDAGTFAPKKYMIEVMTYETYFYSQDSTTVQSCN